MGLKGIRPKYINKRTGTYTWYIKRPNPIKITYSKDDFTMFYEQGPFKKVNIAKLKPYVYCFMWFANDTGDVPLYMTMREDGIIELHWAPKPPLKHAPFSIEYTTENTIVVIWRVTRIPRHLNMLGHRVKSEYDKQGNLFYLSSGLPTGFAYTAELISPGTYVIQPHPFKSTSRWAFLMQNVEKIIHV